TFTLTVNGVRDEAGHTLDPTANSKAFMTLKFVPRGVKWEVYTGIGGTPVAALTGTPAYPNSPLEVRLFAGFDSPNGYSDNFGARMSAFVIPPETADYDFFIRSDDASQLFISTNDDPANLSATPIAQEPGCCNAFLEPPASQTTASPIHLVGGQRYFLVALYKEGGGGDYCQVAMRKAGDPTAANQLAPISGSLVAVSVDKALADSITLPVSLMSPPGSGDASKPGFNARIYQVDQSGANNVATLIASAEHELAGIIGPNVANLAGASGGVFSIDTIVNWNQEFNTGGDGVTEAGDFQSTSPPSRPDVGIPGMPGTGTAAHNLDSIAGELVTYVEFPAAGVYVLGVNSDDGFKVTASETPPANNQALVVTSPASAAGAYHTV